MSKPAPKQTFKPGGVYTIDFIDHASVDRQYVSSPLHGREFVLRQRGVFLKETSRYVVLETNRHLTDDGPDQRIDSWEIIKSAIVDVQFHGMEKQYAEKARARTKARG